MAANAARWRGAARHTVRAYIGKQATGEERRFPTAKAALASDQKYTTFRKAALGYRWLQRSQLPRQGERKISKGMKAFRAAMHSRRGEKRVGGKRNLPWASARRGLKVGML